MPIIGNANFDQRKTAVSRRRSFAVSPLQEEAEFRSRKGSAGFRRGQPPAFCSEVVNTIGTLMRTFTGFPFFIPGENVHCPTASVAARSNL